jgi:hypothetical protein
MPRVTFVNEHRIVEVEKGRLVSDIARELGIAFCRETFARTGIGDTTVWIKGAADCVSPPGLIERLKGARGWRRFADRTRVLGDCEIYTQPALGNRLGVERDLAPPPSPMVDPSLVRAPDAAGTAAFPYGHPSAVGKGTRSAVARGAGAEGAKTKAAETAKPAATPAAAAAPAAEAPTQSADPEAEKAARIAEKKARQAALKARLAAGNAEPEAAAAPPVEAAAPAPEPAPPEPPPAPEAKPPMDPDKAARIAEKKARQAALKARLAADPNKDGSS